LTSLHFVFGLAEEENYYSVDKLIHFFVASKVLIALMMAGYKDTENFCLKVLGLPEKLRTQKKRNWENSFDDKTLNRKGNFGDSSMKEKIPAL
jgi:hypothetical protein